MKVIVGSTITVGTSHLPISTESFFYFIDQSNHKTYFKLNNKRGAIQVQMFYQTFYTNRRKKSIPKNTY